MLETLDAAAVRRWCATGLESMRRHRHEIDNLNVYPVPDGDTGTNLVLTLTAAVEALDGPGPAAGLGPTLRCLARGALLGARGNSGVIMSQVFAGMAEALAGVGAAGGPAYAAALARAATAARQAVAAPAEGTILTVARAAADAAASAVAAGHGSAAPGGSRAPGGSGAAGRPGTVLGAAVSASADGARAALARTPEQLPALARAGVVDAGGRGLVVLLDALVEVVTGAAPDAGAPPAPSGAGRAVAPAPVAGAPLPARRAGVDAMRETGSDEYGYEVQYLLDAPESAVAGLRARLHRLGDSLVVVGTSGPDPECRTWNVHVHVNDVGSALEAGVEAGRPYRISVVRFADQTPAPVLSTADDVRSWAAGAPRAEPVVDRPRDRAVVVVCDGDDMAELFAAEGAAVVRRHPGGAAPSTGEILAAIHGTGAGRIVLLPNDPNVFAAASASAAEVRSARVRAGVVPTRSPVQALAALAVRDPARRFEDEVIAMAEAAGACRYAEVTTASRDALTVAGRCARGDILALVQGEVSLIGQDLVDTCRRLLDRLLAAGGELVTLLTGAQAPADLADLLTAHVQRAWPFVEVAAYRGGQSYYPLVVGVE